MLSLYKGLILYQEFLFFKFIPLFLCFVLFCFQVAVISEMFKSWLLSSILGGLWCKFSKYFTVWHMCIKRAPRIFIYLFILPCSFSFQYFSGSVLHTIFKWPRSLWFLRQENVYHCFSHVLGNTQWSIWTLKGINAELNGEVMGPSTLPPVVLEGGGKLWNSLWDAIFLPMYNIG